MSNFIQTGITHIALMLEFICCSQEINSDMFFYKYGPLWEFSVSSQIWILGLVLLFSPYRFMYSAVVIRKFSCISVILLADYVLGTVLAVCIDVEAQKSLHSMTRKEYGRR